jgi:hypothetical protein
MRTEDGTEDGPENELEDEPEDDPEEELVYGRENGYEERPCERT